MGHLIGCGDGLTDMAESYNKMAGDVAGFTALYQSQVAKVTRTVQLWTIS